MGVDFALPDRVRNLRPSWFPRGNQVQIPSRALKLAGLLRAAALNRGSGRPRKTSFSSPPRAAREEQKKPGDTSVAVADTPDPGREDPAPLKLTPVEESWGFSRSCLKTAAD